MPLDELRHTLSDSSAAIEALSRRLQGRLHPSEERLIGHVRTTIRRFEEVIDALIAYELASEPIDARPVELNHVVAAAVDTHVHELQPSDRFDVDRLPTVQGDKALLLAMFRVLVENAIKYRHPQRPLRARVRMEPASRAMCRIVTEDNGIGIDPTRAHGIFEMFERGDPRRFPGQGLGLAAVRRIAEAHAGTVSAQMLPSGTAIHVQLPLEQATTPSGPVIRSAQARHEVCASAPDPSAGYGPGGR